MSSSPVESPVRLSRREQEVASLVAEGLTNREIASRLFISERTVDGHLEHVREKLGVNTRAQIAAWVVRKNSPTVSVAPAPSVGQPAYRPRRTATSWPWLGAALVLVILGTGIVALRFRTPPLPQGPMIETIAGGQCLRQIYPGGCDNGNDLLAIDAGLARPSDVAVDSNGLIYIADFGNKKVRLVSHGAMSTLIGGGQKSLEVGAIATSVSLDSVGSIAVDRQNRLYFLTTVNGILQVWRVEHPGAFMTRVASVGPTEEGQTLGPNLPLGGLAVADDGTLYIADRAGNLVWRVPAGGTATPYAGTGKFGFSGDLGAATSAQLAWPIGLAIDGHGNLYIADSQNNRIRRVDTRGRITTLAGVGDEGNKGDGGPADHARLSFPFGVAVAPDGTVVIADTGNHRLRRVVTSTGTVEALAGTGQSGFAGDSGPALQANLSGPEAVAFDREGDLLIADTENQRVREIPRLSPSR